MPHAQAKYPSGNGLDVAIKLCWDVDSWPAADAAKFAQGAALWEAAVTETWFGQGAHLTLDIDDDCDSDHTKIGVTAGRPSAGTESAQANFKFTNLDPNGCNANTASWTKCVKMFAVRSMGYYLGFADEESVSGEGNNVPCPDGHQETVRAVGDTSVSTANGHSVMSLCHAFPKADSYQLSSGDINGVKAAYGGGGNVVAGTRYALRFTSNEGSWKGRYLSVDNWGSESKIRTSLINPVNDANVITFSYVSGSSILGGGESIRIFRPDGRALCLTAPCTQAGCNPPSWTTQTTGVGCTWTASMLGGAEAPYRATTPCVCAQTSPPKQGNPWDRTLLRWTSVSSVRCRNRSTASDAQR